MGEVRPRERLAGRYEILGLVGAGGMGTVYRARDLELGEDVALKMLRSERVDSSMLERFRSEVRLARRVTHTNVARVFDIGEHQAERFLTMEFVEGESLASLLARRGTLELHRALAIAAAICAGMAAAHAVGVVHRDLKPDNVLLAADGRVVVTDFGIARCTVAASLAAHETGAGVMIGTPAYMSPEQVEGRADIDARADVYALGATLFELFTGRRAWQGDVPIAVAAARLAAPPPDPRQARPDLPEAVAAVVRRCLARAPADRFADAAEVGAALASVSPTSPAAPTLARTSAPPPRPVSPDAAKTVAVLPVHNQGAPEDDFVAEGITEDLIDALSMIGLRVRPRAAVAKYEGSKAESREIGRELGVQVVVETSFRRLPGAIRLRTRVVSVVDGFQLWAKRFDRSEAALLVVSDEVARAIAEALTVRLVAPARQAPSDPVVIELYLRARAEMRQLRATPKPAVELLEQAVARAPGDPTVLAALAIARAKLWHWSGEGRAEVEEAAERAVAAAPWLGEARLSLGMSAFYGGEYERALREGRRAAALAPGLAQAHFLVGRLVFEAGLFDEGIRWLENSMEIDPKAEATYHDLCRAYELRGSRDAADRTMARCASETGARSIELIEARLWMWRRDTERARARLQGTPSDEIRPLLEYLASGSCTLEQVHALTPPMGRITAREVTARRRTFARQLFAEVACYFGHEDAAFTALAAAVDSGLLDLAWLDHCPTLAPLRARPKFPALRARVDERARRLIAAYTEPD